MKTPQKLRLNTCRPRPTRLSPFRERDQLRLQPNRPTPTSLLLITGGKGATTSVCDPYIVAACLPSPPGPNHPDVANTNNNIGIVRTAHLLRQVTHERSDGLELVLNYLPATDSGRHDVGIYNHGS